MKNDEDLVNRFNLSLQKDSGVLMTDEQAKDGLETLAKFFGLLWKYDQVDKQKVMQTNT